MGMQKHPDTTQGESAKEFFEAWESNVAALDGLYDPADERDSCGVGFVAALDGKRRRDVVEAGIAALKAIWHRGAVDADGKTGDGAGIHVEIPQKFFADAITSTGDQPVEGSIIAVGQVFLPKTDLVAQELCRQIIETEILAFGYGIYGWRQVPIDTACIGEKANATRPEIEQIMIRNLPGTAEDAFERDLYVIRRRIEKAAIAAQVDLYICSLSCRSIIYKGMFLAEHLTEFYPDLLDERFVSRFVIYHQRYSTNTFPTWKLAQPFRRLAHNGEINTISGNINWMKSHETRLSHPDLDPWMKDIKPLVQAGGSDTATLDNVFELLTFAGRDAPAAKALMIPASVGGNSLMKQSHRDMFAYCNAVMEPWDGPAALCATDGRWVIAGLDRSGLRPLRYTVTEDKLLIVGSETGMVRVPENNVAKRGRLGPGEVIGVDLQEARLYGNEELLDLLASRQDFSSWVGGIQKIGCIVRSDVTEPVFYQGEELRRRQLAVGTTLEELEAILHPMVESGSEAIGSMGDDTPLAVLSTRFRGLSHYFRQGFSQVTNPPIDSLRESRVMSLVTRLGNLGNILDQSAEQCEMLQLPSPVLTSGEYEALRSFCGTSGCLIDCSFPAKEGEAGLREAIARIRREAEESVRGGCTHVFLTDENQSPDRAYIPMILATAAVHTHLVRNSLRTFTSLNVRASTTLDVHSIAVTIGVGATTVNPYLAQENIADRHRRGLFGKLTLRECMERYRKAVDKGLLKIMSKMGISIVASYRGGCNFEAVGLSRALTAEFFPGMPSRISGIGLPGIARNVLTFHQEAWDSASLALPVGGFYKLRRKGEQHAFDGSLIHMLQTAVATDSFTIYKRYADAVRAQPPVALRDLLDFKEGRTPIPVEEVESITQLRKRLISPAISLGALSPEAHETLSIAMNRIGAKSDSGEGGEDPERAKPRPNGDNASSAIKQVASGRFGVTAQYLNDCRELEIKVAQGAKPGEGGQLPGFKVTELIAKLRHATPGVTLISPPPHHDIYSIEDLAQLIYDLKQINPEATVTVKLVARSGIGTIAAGVAKAKADAILISGHSGGTGASPLTSVKYAGLPWELGLAEAHQVLMLNRLRHRVKLRTDGGIKTGRDVVIAAMLGAEEFGIGTASLVAMGCIMVRQCHSNTCPVGVCSQDEAMRKKFEGTPEKVINLFSFIAEDVRNILASLGFRTLNEVIGRTDLLRQVSRGADYLDDLDLNSLLSQADPGPYARYCTLEGRNEVPDTLDAQMISDAKPLFDHGEKMQLHYNVQNTQRAIGTRISSLIVRKFGMTTLAPGHLTARLRGSAGQSLGAFAVQGLKLEVLGDANDYVGKGLSGATITVRPFPSSRLVSNQNAIIGNTVLYGATAGELYAAGQAGERFAVRNSGAVAVVEGCGSNACEYMTGGTVVVLGEIGDNFGAGFTGGMAFVLDSANTFEKRVNPESLFWTRVTDERWEQELRRLVERHVEETGSLYATNLLHKWEDTLPHFWQIVPKDYARIIGFALPEEELAKSA
ncbi:glutamate synthase large subunit [Acetobacter orleanensis]|uniref:Glutamate synthase n=1 Tax=Acetobacter orleanensis TaxID=104099 RepID=A0A4Y3TM50_9PROT|nr:glutamate synthase large subunit [Acetobacter orleanensis]KXV62590.1 glutamate synthase [Acetobacter orleanensis]PCD79963.1 glutamate synthase large subunit [Acetobacter orleanensis]GAN68273.1 glutamate synthase [Acetobacter orleanensis JCM 7639]GBR31175.1 glutamate synthase large chain [Acetobacter orleanensis NRIC 0473]GEB82834.1 glutamate synthase [Acetobacter orleanensis]